MRSRMLVFFAFMLVANNATANAALIVMNNKKVPPPVNFSPLLVNDGFVVEDGFFRSGPAFRLCSPEYGNQAGVFNKDGEKICGIRDYQHEDLSLTDRMSGNYVIIKAVDVSPKEYLDILYGEGAVTLTGVGGIDSNTGRDKLVLYYKIKE